MKTTNFITLILGIFLTLALQAAEAPEKIQKDRLQLGKTSSSAAKEIIFDTADGASNKKLSIDKVSKKITINTDLEFDEDLLVEGVTSLQNQNTNIGAGTAQDVFLNFDEGSVDTPALKWNESTSKLQFTNDGTNFKDLGSGSGGGGSGINLLTDFNADFEIGSPSPSDWTASGGTFTSNTSTPLFALQSGDWDSTGSAQTLCSTAATIERGQIGQKCQAKIYYKWPSGVANDLKMTVDDTGVEIGSVNLTPTTGDNVASVFLVFDCPDTATDTLQMCLESTVADAASITVDDAFLGSGNSTILEKPQDVFSAAVSSTDVVSRENVDWINGNCTDAAAGVSTCIFNSGYFTGTPNCSVTDENTTATFGNIIAVSSTQVSFKSWTTGGAATAENLSITCQNVGSSANRSAITLETSSQSWSGYHDSTCSWARTNTAYGDPTADATCNLVQKTNTGFGSVISADSGGSDLPGIVFTPSTSGKYYVIAEANDVGCGATNSEFAMQLVDGSGFVIGNSAGDCSAGGVQGSPLVASGLYTVAAGSPVTIKIQTKMAGGVAITMNKNAGDNAINWSIFRIDQPFPTPVFTELQNLVKSPNTGGMKHFVASLNCDAGSTIVRQYGSWLTSIGNIAAGACAIVWPVSTFSDVPVCQVTPQTVTGADPIIVGFTAEPTTTGVTVDASDNAGTDSTAYDFQLSCTGP